MSGPGGESRRGLVAFHEDRAVKNKFLLICTQQTQLWINQGAPP